MSSAETHEEFIHHIAIKLSRVLNIVNPNDLLAQRVTDIAKTNTLPGFISGLCFSIVIELRLMPLQRQSHLASFRIHFLRNCTQKYCRMPNRKLQVLLPNLCWVSQFTTVMFLYPNQRVLGVFFNDPIVYVFLSDLQYGLLSSWILAPHFSKACNTIRTAYSEDFYPWARQAGEGKEGGCRGRTRTQ